MNYYETLYIVHPALEAGRLKDIILSVETVFTSNASNVVCTQVWGKKKLAYHIDKQKYGTYVLVQFESDGKNINTISTDLEINPNILAHLTTKISDSDLQKEARSLDDQITGEKSEDSPSEKPVEEKEKKDNVKSADDDTATDDIQPESKSNDTVENEEQNNDNSEEDSSEEESSKEESEE